jgi:hypothetical protein
MSLSLLTSKMRLSDGSFRQALTGGYRWAGVPFAAVMGCLQPGIDPVFLTLASAAGTVPVTAHGGVVAVTQGGAALGALAVWHAGGRMDARVPVAAGAVGAIASLSFVFSRDLMFALSLRGVYGLCMGIIYARAMSHLSARRPAEAYGVVFLAQLVFSTILALTLPGLGRAIGSRGALATLVIVPLLAGAALAGQRACDGRALPHMAAHGCLPACQGQNVARWAMAASTFLFICATMMVWSFSGALAAREGLSDSLVGEAVAIGSVAGALTALAVMREGAVIPLPVTAVLAGLALVSPLLFTSNAQPAGFVGAITALNIGSTAIIVRCSGLASAMAGDGRFRTLVACTHSLGLVAGPLCGSGLIAVLGWTGLVMGCLGVVAAAVVAVMLAGPRMATSSTTLAR